MVFFDPFKSKVRAYKEEKDKMTSKREKHKSQSHKTEMRHQNKKRIPRKKITQKNLSTVTTSRT